MILFNIHNWQSSWNGINSIFKLIKLILRLIFYWNYEIDDNYRFVLSTRFHSNIPHAFGNSLVKLFCRIGQDWCRNIKSIASICCQIKVCCFFHDFRNIIKLQMGVCTSLCVPSVVTGSPWQGGSKWSDKVIQWPTDDDVVKEIREEGDHDHAVPNSLKKRFLV